MLRAIVSDDADKLVGQVIAGRYRLERMVAKGGMGRVYLATQLPLERRVAIKVLAPRTDSSIDPQFVRRFFLEAAVCARLSHPNIITVHDYGEYSGGQLFMAMEYLDGEPLSALIKREGPLTAERALTIALPIARGLREAHAHGIIHRDLKPGNVMLLRGKDEDAGDSVKVLDFGLVKIFGEEADPLPAELGELDLTRAGILMGSPRYMSPEQIRNETLDPRTDIYSLGVILYHMVSGRPPFSAKTSVEVMHAHLHDPVPALEGVPARAAKLIMGMLEKDRVLRVASANDLIAEIKSILAPTASPLLLTSEHSVTNTMPAPPPAALAEPPPTPSAPTRKVPLLIVSAFAAIALAAAAITLFTQPSSEPTRTPVATSTTEPATPELLIKTNPPGAAVFDGARQVGQTPLSVPIDQPITLELRHPDRETYVLTRAAATTDQTMTIELAPKVADTPPPQPPPAKKSPPTKPEHEPPPDIRLSR